MTDWQAWHQPYDVADSPLSRRLRVIQQQIRDWLDGTGEAPVTVLSACAGDGRDLIEVLAERPDRYRVRAVLLELDEGNCARARRAAAALPGATVECRQVDASTSDTFDGVVPADLVLLCGIFGNISDADVHRLIRAVPQLCRPGGRVIWTRHRGEPDLTPDIRAWFAESGFSEHAFIAPGDVTFSVGVHRFAGPGEPLVAGQRLFTFTR